MKKIVLVCSSITMSVIALAQQSPEWLKSSVFYQIYPSSFQDSDGDGIGDLKGIASRLDYLQSIGVNTVWLNPVFKSDFKDGGYDVIDFYEVDPRFGTNSTLVELAKQVHAKGMRIVLDLVAGHTSKKSPWFQQSMQADKNLQYSNYYIWAPIKPDTLQARGGSRWVEANAPRDKYYLKNFYDIQPALNFGFANPNPNNPWEQSVDSPGPQAVRREIQNIITFWMEKGLDGFRVDLAASLVKNDPDKKATIAWWQKMNSWFHQQFPTGVLIAEWFNPKQSIAAGFDMDFLRPGNLTSAYERGRKTTAKVYFDLEGKGSLATWASYFNDQYNSTLHKGFISLPTGNHDSPRMTNEERNDLAPLKVLMTFLLTQPGIPLIYYGDEIGMRYIPNSPDVEGSGIRAGSRTPMQWDEGKNAGFSTAATSHLYLPIDSLANRPTVASQQSDSNSLLTVVKKLLKLRQSSTALGNTGAWKLLSDTSTAYPMIYMRQDGTEKYIIAINPTAQKLAINIPSQHATKTECIFTTATKSIYTKGKAVDKITIPATAASIFSIE